MLVKCDFYNKLCDKDIFIVPFIKHIIGIA